MRLWFGVLACVVALAATMAADTIPAQGGNVELTPLAHAHVQIEHGGKVIHIDPQPQAPQASVKPADQILITDVHGDHFDPKAIDMVDKASTVLTDTVPTFKFSIMRWALARLEVQTEAASP